MTTLNFDTVFYKDNFFNDCEKEQANKARVYLTLESKTNKVTKFKEIDYNINVNINAFFVNELFLKEIDNFINE